MKIPSQNNPIMKQSNSSSIFGDIIDSFNLDLTTDLGKVKVAKTLLSKKSTGYGVSDFGGTQSLGVGGFDTFGNNIYMISGSRVWKGGNSPSDSIAIDTGSPDVSIQYGDIKNFNSKLYVATYSKIVSTNGSYSDVYSYGTPGTHLLEVHKNRLYFSFDGYKVGSLDTSDTPVVSGAYSVDLNLPGFTISFLKSDGDYLWIGLVNNLGGYNQNTYVVRWDGSNTDVTTKHVIQARAVMAGCIVNGVPHVMDCNGRLLGFNGAFFTELDRLPLKRNEFIFSIGTTHERGIHPNGMIYDSINDEILINIANVIDFTANVPRFYNFPGGVWAYKKENGLYHKYSPSLQPIANSGNTGLVDYGQYNVVLAGAISILGLRPLSTEKGRIMFGSVIFDTTIGDYTTTSTVVLCTDDTLDTSKKYGYFTTREIHSSLITETWKQITALYKRLLTATDKIILKYKTRDDTPTQVNIVWTDIDRVTTSSDLSATYSEGDEMQVIQGNGSGKSFHIKSISSTLVILDDSMESGVIGLNGVANFSKFIKLGEVLYNDEQGYKTFTLSKQNISPKIQFKVCIQSTGDNELDSLFINSESNIK